jgi:HEAT repeat protein
VRDDDIRADVQRLVVSSYSPLTEDEVWDALRVWGPDVAPFLAEAYDATTETAGRAALVHHAIPYARSSDAAYRLGLHALEDRSPKVRRRACALLAYSLRDEAVPVLERALEHENGDTQDDAYAALVAIDQQNHHFYRDRDRTGHIFWIVNPEDEPPPAPEPTGRLDKIYHWLFRP